MTNFNFRTACIGLFQSIVFGALGGAAGGAISLGCWGVVLGAMEYYLIGGVLGGLYLGLIGGSFGFIVGLGTGTIGWVPSCLFPGKKLVCNLLASVLGLLVGTSAWIYMEYYQHGMGGMYYWGGILLLICGISGAITSNRMTELDLKKGFEPRERLV